MNNIQTLYKELLNKYGKQGWWPIQGRYHPEDYSYPKDQKQVFEICLGSILTQNTSWTSVDKALKNLKRSNALDIKGLKRLSEGKLRELIKPTGYYNQKARYIRNFIIFFEKLEGKTPARHELLDVIGIGPETADSMLLYAFKQPIFVVDAYTKRIFLRLGLIEKKAPYQDIQKLFMENLPKDHELFNEYHALIVEHAKQHCNTKKICDGCCLKKICKNNNI